MNQSCVTLDDLVATTQAYVDAIKRLSNLSMIDTADLKDGTQRRWLEQVDDEIATAACMVVKLGGPNDTTLMLPCQRPELKALYIKYELLKADAVFDFRVSVEAKAAFPDEEPEDVKTSVAASNSIPQDPPVGQQHKDGQYIEPNSCDSGTASIHAPANEGLNTPSKPSPPPESSLKALSTDIKLKTEHLNDERIASSPPRPQAVDTPLTQGKSDDSVFMQQAMTLCEALKDLGNDKDRLTERIEQLRNGIQNPNLSVLEGTVAELEFNFRIYAANNHPLEVAIAEVMSTALVAEDEKSTPRIPQRLFDLGMRAEKLFKQNTMHGDMLGLKRDPRSFLVHSHGPLVLVE